MLNRLFQVAALWLALASPVLASQATLVTPAAPLPMTSLASFLNAAYLSIGSCNSGNSAPANGTGSAAFAGECWINTTSNPWVFSYTADGTHWSEFGTLNTSTFAWTSYSAGVLITTGASGANIPFLNVANTWSAAQTFPNSSLTYAMIQNVMASRLLGNPTGSAAAPSEISLDATLAFSGSTVKCTTATGSQNGCGHPDGTTITINGSGVYTAIGASATSIDASGLTSISNGKASDFLYQNGANVGHSGLPYAAFAAAAGAL